MSVVDKDDPLTKWAHADQLYTNVDKTGELKPCEKSEKGKTTVKAVFEKVDKQINKQLATHDAETCKLALAKCQKMFDAAKKVDKGSIFQTGIAKAFGLWNAKRYLNSIQKKVSNEVSADVFNEIQKNMLAGSFETKSSNHFIIQGKYEVRLSPSGLTGTVKLLDSGATITLKTDEAQKLHQFPLHTIIEAIRSNPECITRDDKNKSITVKLPDETSFVLRRGNGFIRNKEGKEVELPRVDPKIHAVLKPDISSILASAREAVYGLTGLLGNKKKKKEFLETGVIPHNTPDGRMWEIRITNSRWASIEGPKGYPEYELIQVRRTQDKPIQTDEAFGDSILYSNRSRYSMNEAFGYFGIRLPRFPPNPISKDQLKLEGNSPAKILNAIKGLQQQKATLRFIDVTSTNDGKKWRIRPLDKAGTYSFTPIIDSFCPQTAQIEFTEEQNKDIHKALQEKGITLKP